MITFLWCTLGQPANCTWPSHSNTQRNLLLLPLLLALLLLLLLPLLLLLHLPLILLLLLLLLLFILPLLLLLLLRLPLILLLLLLLLDSNLYLAPGLTPCSFPAPAPALAPSPPPTTSVSVKTCKLHWPSHPNLPTHPEDYPRFSSWIGSLLLLLLLMLLLLLLLLPSQLRFVRRSHILHYVCTTIELEYWNIAILRYCHKRCITSQAIVDKPIHL